MLYVPIGLNLEQPWATYKFHIYVGIEQRVILQTLPLCFLMVFLLVLFEMFLYYQGPGHILHKICHHEVQKLKYEEKLAYLYFLLVLYFHNYFLVLMYEVNKPNLT